MDYSPLVGRITTDYREVFGPGSPLLAEDGNTVSMSSVVGATANLLWKVWIPPGTRSLQATLFAYASPPESKVLLRMHQPPVGGLDSVTSENSAAVDLGHVLALLIQGAEIPCYTPPGAGAVKLSDGRIDSPVVTTAGGWLYIKAIQVPGDKIFELAARVTADKAQYLNWYNNAIWDEQGNPVPGSQPPGHDERWLLGRIQGEGLIEPLRKLSKTTDDDSLIEAAKSSGLWAALLKFAK